MKSKTKLAIGDCAYILSTRISTCSPSLVLRNWLLLYFSVKTKSLVHYHFLNIRIVFAVRCAYLRACADATRINEALHPNRSHWKHLSLRDQRNDSWYNEPRLCNAVWSRRFGACCVVEHALLFSNHNRISPMNLSVCNVFRIESLVLNGSIRIRVSLHL